MTIEKTYECKTMTIEKTYKCDLCGDKMEPDRPAHENPQGWGLTWVGERHEFLEPTRPWWDSPIHLCRKCVGAVSRFADAAKAARELE